MKNFRTTTTQVQVPTTSPNHMEEVWMKKEEWTDEKHRMYLKCMEASFVNQLYGSKQMLAIPTTTSSNTTTSTTSSRQSKVTGVGCGRKTKFGRENSHASIRSNEKHDSSNANSWIHHSRCSSKDRRSVASSINNVVEESPQVSEFLGHGRNGINSSHHLHNYLCSHIEMSDQNFVDDEDDEEVECQKKNVKKLKSFDI